MLSQNWFEPIISMAWTLLEFHTLINLGSIPQSLRNFLSTHQIFVVTNVRVSVCSSLSRNFGKKAKPSYSPLNKKLMRQMTHVVVGQKIIDLILKWKVKECKSWLGEKRLKQLDVRTVCFFYTFDMQENECWYDVHVSLRTFISVSRIY